MSEKYGTYVRNERAYTTIPWHQESDIEIEGLTEEDFQRFAPVLQEFLRSYADKPSTLADVDWLSAMMAKELPEETEEDIIAISQDIVAGIHGIEDVSIEAIEARSNGQQPEEWVAEKISSFFVTMETQVLGDRLATLDRMLYQSNQEMQSVITTKSGTISMNPNLDGFIAEQDLVSTFNRNAHLNGSSYEARLMNTEGANFGRNSVDIGIYDKSTGHLTQRYQVKAGGNESATVNMIKKGNYNNQRLVVPQGQVEGVKGHFTEKRSISDCLEAPDGTTSAPLDKDKCKNWQRDIQEGKSMPTRNWTDFDNKSLALHIGKEVAFAGLAGAALGAGMNMAGKALSGERIKADEVMAAALQSGADAGMKAATAGALTVASKKGLLPCLAGASAKSIATVACFAIESVRIIGDYLSGDIDGGEAAARFMWLGATTYIAATLVDALGLGALMGGAIALACTPVGAAVAIGAGLVAGAIAFGSEICEVASSIVEGIGSVVSDVWSGVTTVISDIGSAVGEFFDSLFG